MKQSEALCQYYKDRDVQVTNSCHPLTKGARYVIGIAPLSSTPTSNLKRSSHALVAFREGRKIYNILNMNTKTKGVHGFPGGEIEGNESPQEGVQREITEELGYEPMQYKLTPLGFLVVTGAHFPLFLVDVTDQIPTASEITGSTDIAIILLEALYAELPGPAQSQVRSTISQYIR